MDYAVQAYKRGSFPLIKRFEIPSSKFFSIYSELIKIPIILMENHVVPYLMYCKTTTIGIQMKQLLLMKKLTKTKDGAYRRDGGRVDVGEWT